MRPLTILHALSILAILNLFTAAGPLRCLDCRFVLGNQHKNPHQILPKFLDRRGSKDLGNGWWMYYDTWKPLLQLDDSAASLESFFQAISENANGIWLNLGPQHYIELSKGELQIRFFSDALPITWMFVARFANTMRRAIGLGFVGMFDMRIVTPTGVVVYVHLRIRNALAAAAA